MDVVDWDGYEEFDDCGGCELCVVPCLECDGYGYFNGESCEGCDGDGEVYDLAEHQIDDEKYDRW